MQAKRQRWKKRRLIRVGEDLVHRGSIEPRFGGVSFCQRLVVQQHAWMAASGQPAVSFSRLDFLCGLRGRS